MLLSVRSVDLHVLSGDDIIVIRRLKLLVDIERGHLVPIHAVVLRWTEIRLQRLELEKILIDDRQILWLQPKLLISVINI